MFRSDLIIKQRCIKRHSTLKLHRFNNSFKFVSLLICTTVEKFSVTYLDCLLIQYYTFLKMNGNQRKHLNQRKYLFSTFLSARPLSKCSTSLMSFTPHNNPTLLILRKRKPRRREQSSHMHMAINSRAEISTQRILAPQ